MHMDKHFIHTTGGRDNGVKCGLIEKIVLDLVVVLLLRNNRVVVESELTIIEIKKKLLRSHKNRSYLRGGLINRVVVRRSFTVY